MRTLLATVVRGLRARALLSAGSVLLTALAIGSAVLGPIFQVAVTNSYLVTRLDEAPNELTGLSWRFQPGSQLDRDVDQAVRRAGEAAAAAARGTAVRGPADRPREPAGRGARRRPGDADRQGRCVRPPRDRG